MVLVSNEEVNTRRLKGVANKLFLALNDHRIALADEPLISFCTALAFTTIILQPMDDYGGRMADGGNSGRPT